MDYNLSVIPEEETKNKAVLVREDKETPFIEGKSDDNYLCGVCNNLLCKNISRGQIINLVFKCPNCGAFNKVRGT